MGKARFLKQQRKIEKAEQEKQQIKKRKKKTVIALLIFVSIAVLIFCALAIVHYLKEKDIKRVVIQTEKGDIELELYPKAAPKTVENFIKLTQEGFYDGTTFHRVVENFIIQGGDPLSKDDDPANDGTGDPGYVFEDEINPKSLGLTFDQTKELEALGYRYRYDIQSIPHEPGVISMANSGPNTNGSQFFIVTATAQPSLNGRHTAFGRVVKGMEVVQKIEQGDIINKMIIK